MSPTGISPRTRKQAQSLRNNATEAERKLWQVLRQLKTADTQFRRQAPIGPYIADFASHAAHLIIELDGDQHAFQKKMAGDAKRTAWLATQGYRVIRFWNSDIFNNIEGVTDTVLGYLSETPTPTPPHKGEGLDGSSLKSPLISSKREAES